MNANRPKNLSLTTISFPITAISSILHRATGILLFLFIPISLYWLEQSLASQAGFEHLTDCLSGLIPRLITWAILSALFFHLFAGIRHIIMDMGYAESLQSGRRGAKLIICFGVLASIAVGVWLW